MESRLRRFFLKSAASATGGMLDSPAGRGVTLLTCMLLCISSMTAQARQPDEGSGGTLVIEPKIERRDIRQPAIDTEDFEIGVFGGLLSVEDFGVNTVMGARLAYHVSEDFFFEFAYGTADTQETSYEKLSGAASLLTEEQRKLSYYNVSLGYNLFPGEAFLGRSRAFNTAFYAIGGIGSTEFGGDDRFTMNFGFGYRLLANDWLALHVDARDHIFDSDLLGESKTTHNLEMHGGITIFF